MADDPPPAPVPAGDPESINPAGPQAEGVESPVTAERTGEAAPAGPSTAPRKSAAQLMIERREQAENEFREVKTVCTFYGALLLPILVLTGLAYQGVLDALTTEIWGACLFYPTIGGFAWYWRREVSGLLKWPRGLGPAPWAIATGTAVLTLCSVWLMLGAARRFSWPILDEASHLTEAGWSTVAILVWVSVLPAVFEEIAFRGILLGRLQKLMSPGQAAWVSAILFGVIHFNVVGLAVFLVPMAWMAAWLTCRTGSLFPAMLLHLLHNAGVILFFD